MTKGCYYNDMPKAYHFLGGNRDLAPGAFEVFLYLNRKLEVHIFSKLLLGYWPNVNEVVRRIRDCIAEFEENPESVKDNHGFFSGWGFYNKAINLAEKYQTKTAK